MLKMTANEKPNYLFYCIYPLSDILVYYFYFSEKKGPGILCESSAGRQFKLNFDLTAKYVAQSASQALDLLFSKC